MEKIFESETYERHPIPYQNGYLTNYEADNNYEHIFKIYDESFNIIEEVTLNLGELAFSEICYDPVLLASNGETIWGACMIGNGNGGLITINSNFEVIDNTRYSDLLETPSQKTLAIVYANGELWSTHRKYHGYYDGEYHKSYYLCRHSLE